MAADLRRAVQPILALRGQARVLPFERIGVVDQGEIERLPEAVRHLAGRAVDDRRVEIVVLAVGDIGPHRGAVELAAHARGVLVDERRVEVGANPGVSPGMSGFSSSTRLVLVRVVPGEHGFDARRRRTRPVRVALMSGPAVVVAVGLRISSGRRVVGDAVRNRCHVLGEAAGDRPRALSSRIPHHAEPRAERAVLRHERARLIEPWFLSQRTPRLAVRRLPIRHESLKNSEWVRKFEPEAGRRDRIVLNERASLSPRNFGITSPPTMYDDRAVGCGNRCRTDGCWRCGYRRSCRTPNTMVCVPVPLVDRKIRAFHVHVLVVARLGRADAAERVGPVPRARCGSVDQQRALNAIGRRARPS